MATVKSKLKEVLDQKLKETSKAIIDNPNDEIARARYKDINDINNVCIARKRY